MKIKFKSFFPKVNYIFFIILAIPLILNIYWFKEGNIMGFAEGGLPFYSFQNAYEANKDAWAYYTLGYPLNISSASIPTYWFLNQLQKNMHIPGFILQAVFLWLVFVISGISIYFLFEEIFPNRNKTFGLIAVLFYWFNPFALVNVWNRFLNNYFFFYALLPVSVYLLIRGLNRKKYLFAILIGLVSACFAYALTSVAFNILLWGVIGYVFLFYFICYSSQRLFIFKFFSLTVIFWILVNSWWISQVFSYLNIGSFNAVIATSFTSENNYRTFSLLSERLGNLIDLFRLMHGSFFYDFKSYGWVGIYQFPLVILFEFLVTAIFLLPLIFRRRNFYVLMFGGLTLISIFLAKGNSNPFGEIFDRVFLHFVFLQIFRNSLEKFGFILAFSTSMLFPFGCLLVYDFLKPKLKKIFLAAVFCWILIIWGFPFWSKNVFTSPELAENNPTTGYQVKVPSFYQEASNWLSNKKNNFRLIFLPIGGEGITYSWEKGYSGVELSNQLFPITSVSFNTNIPLYDDISNNLERIFLTKENFSQMMSILNSKYLIIRSDIDWKTRHIRNPQTIVDRMGELSALGIFRKVQQFGELSFWEYLAWNDRTIYVGKDLVTVKGELKSDDVVQLADQDVLYSSQNNPPKGLIKSEIIHPDYIFEQGAKYTSSNFSFTDDLIFPAVKLFPSNPLYPFILLKEKVELASARSQEELIIKKITLLRKRLIEGDDELKQNNQTGANIAFTGYSKQLKELLPDLSSLGPSSDDKFLLQEELLRVFQKHIDFLNELKTEYPKNGMIDSLQSRLKDDLITAGISPRFGNIEKADKLIKNSKTYQFQIENDGNYELLVDAKLWSKYYKFSPDQPFLLQIDNEVVYRKGISKNNYISFGSFYFNSGKHEIGWNAPEPINLSEISGDLSFKVDHGEETKIFNLNSFDPYSKYILSFDYLIKKGSGVEVSIEQNNEKVGKDAVPNFLKYVGPDLYNFEEKHFSSYFVPFAGADSAKLIFRARAWNNCLEALKYKGNGDCQNKEVSQRFDLPTEFLVTNVSLTRIPTEIPFLLKDNNLDLSPSTPLITYTKINNSEYRIKVVNARKPFVLVLSQLYDPGWKILSKEGLEIGKEHFIANGYANGWIMDKLGDNEFIIKFTPQDLLNKGKIISAGIFLVGIFFIGREILKYYK